MFRIALRQSSADKAARVQCAAAHRTAQIVHSAAHASFYHGVTRPLLHPTTMPYPYNLALAAGLMLIVLSCGLALALT